LALAVLFETTVKQPIRPVHATASRARRY
jgi:hypothetical protein